MRYLSACCVMLMLLISCKGQDPDLSAEERFPAVRIGVAISMSADTPFFISLLDGIQNCANENNADVITLFADEDPALQSRQIVELAREGIDLLLLNPVSDSLIPAVEEVVELGIPVMTIDRDLSSSCILCHISSDNESGGRMAGEYLAEALHRRGNVVEIMGTDGSSAAEERGRGFQQALSGYPEVQITSSFHADFSREQAYELFAEILEEGGDINGVFAHNDDMILGAIDAAADAGVEGILFTGFDAIEEAVAAVENGDLMATIAQRPFEMGYLGMETALEFLQGRDVPDSIIVDLALIMR